MAGGTKRNMFNVKMILIGKDVFKDTEQYRGVEQQIYNKNKCAEETLISFSVEVKQQST